ncbi:MAG: 16S rRNA (cytosine(967)-C(5))-methyltransferase RsmB [Oscillospiraceae bacterium]|nr:16S rRNA (cytosine(967)-C(5))-methyltransferase RsmB [Oscillospiraceae bacterium]
MSMTPLQLRLLCVRTLIRAAESGSYGNIALGSALNRVDGECSPDPRDKALCTALFQGTVERMLTLDACIRAHSKRPPEKLELPVLCVLRCGMYELLYLHTPEAAAVNLWTEAVKKLKKTSASGMVNAVLRAFLRAGKQIPVPEEPIAAMSVQYSVPVPLLKHLLEDYDRDTVTAFLEDALGEPPLYVRRNPLRVTETEFLANNRAEAVPGIPCAFRLERGQPVQTGMMHVQDLASQLCCLALDPQPGETVLDVCAAPGGKTFTAAELMQDCGKIFACDLHENRVNLIRKGASALGLTCIQAQAGDARTTKKPEADRVLCDVPCSGYGVIRRKPEIRYKLPEEAAGLPEIQYEILEAAADAVRRGGVLVYSTCTVLKRENEAVVRKFLAQHPEFHPEKPWQNSDFLAPYGQEMTTLFPAVLGSDGFFIAKLRRSK